MNATEWRSHFSAWSITSAPLILGMDLRDTQMLDEVWPIISNQAVIQINQQWIGDSGRLHSESNEQARLPNCGSGTGCSLPRWMVWSKALPVPAESPLQALRTAAASSSSAAAILLMNRRLFT